MRLAILGLGLVGGSVARALATRERGDWSVVAWTPSGRDPGEAIAAGVIDSVAASLEEAVAGADIVLLAAPPLACLDLIEVLGNMSLPPAAVVTDAASTKRAIVARATRVGLPFVGGHPMAGRETTGFGAAEAALFVDRPWVICTDNRSDANDAGSAAVERLVRAVGAVPVRMSADAHDAAVAAVSHLPLIVSAALVESVLSDPTVNRADALRLASSGWRDMTRLARGDTAMGVGIVATNADLIAARLRSLRDSIDAWLAAVARDGGPIDREVEMRLANARRSLGETSRDGE
jgi:prephenate dehydrogenase